MSIYNLSETTLRSIAEFFNGDKDLFSYKSGPIICRFFNDNFGYKDSYIFGAQQISRWKMTYLKLVDLDKRNLLKHFFNLILSINYLRTETPLLDNVQLSTKSNEILYKLNSYIEFDGYKIVKVNEEYRIQQILDDEKFLGKGGFASCYLIKSKNIVEKRLLEELYNDEGIVSRFKREFEITSSLSDIDGVIKVFNFDKTRLIYTMELADDVLHNYVINNELSEDDKRTIVYQILTILKNVHNKNVIHRDLTSSNIFIINNRIKIGDFGLGKDLSKIHSHVSMDTKNFGTYIYCDPRQFSALKECDKLSDIFSIGRIINFVFTKNPLDTNHRYKVVSQISTNDEAENRYQSVDEMIDACIAIDKQINNKNYIKTFEEHILHKQLDDSDINYISGFDGTKLFNYIKDAHFIDAFVDLIEKKRINEDVVNKKIIMLDSYAKNNRLTFEDYDRYGNFAIAIILSKASYVTKDYAIILLNWPVAYNRFVIMNKVKTLLLGQIDPSLEEKIDQNIIGF